MRQKKRLLFLLVNSMETQENKSEEVKERKGSLLDLYGMWAENPDADAMEETIRNYHKDPHTRNCFTAICNDAVMATDNVKHLSRMKGIEIENWTKR